jgi:hypothetical protein
MMRIDRAAGRNEPMTLLAAALLLLLPVAMPAQTPTAAQCRDASDQAIAAFKSALPNMPERDREKAAPLVAQLERLLNDGRANGMDECAVWQEIARRVSSS